MPFCSATASLIGLWNILDGNDPQLLVDGPHGLAHHLHLCHEPDRADDATDAADDHRPRRSDGMGQGSGHQASERRHAHEGDRVVAHHPATLVFRNDGLDDGVAGGEPLHHAEANQ